MTLTQDLEQSAINTIRFLSVDGVQQAKSGHPGLPMGAAALAYVVWTRHLRFNPHHPGWANRDRFILSGGHGSMLLYSLLYLTGYDVSLDELKRFRQWGSITPGHPEYGLTPGVEATTGPLGQGFANGVGMAIAEAHLAGVYNRPDHPIIDHFTYAIVTDGDLMEGVSSEAASLAGHLGLGKLIYLYDDNHISIEGSTDLTFTEDRAARFSAYGWQVLTVPQGNDVDAIDSAVRQAKQDPRPSLILCRTQIGYGLPTRQGTSKAHGEPPGEEELNGAKLNLGWPLEPRFYVPQDVLTLFRQAEDRGEQLEKEWQDHFSAYENAFPDLAAELKRRLDSRLPEGWEASLPSFPADIKGMATRSASGNILNAIAADLPELIGGSADLSPSTNTWLKDFPAFQKETPQGRNFHFGVREAGMGSVVNGMAVHGGVIPYGATFLVFSDYMRPAVRISALSHYPSIWVYTHDSIGLGEDGPTHQPVEQIASLRMIPNLVTIRPADANEVVEAWRIAIHRRSGPTALFLTRQALPVLDRTIYADASGVQRGAYVLADIGDDDPELILMASGSEVDLIIRSGERLAAEGVNETYKEAVLPSRIIKRIAVEAGVKMGWERWVGETGLILGMKGFGASAPYKVLYEQYGFTTENVIRMASELLARTI
jgi:transketolase